jgi:hypothetical protein
MRKLDQLRHFQGLAIAVLGLWSMSLAWAFASSTLQEKSLLTLGKIYFEVKDMGFRPGEDFIQREFFIGAPDEDDTNKDISVNIFIQTVEGLEKMKIQVTYLERTRENAKVKFAKATRNLNVIMGGEALRIERTDFAPGELQKLTEDILKAVQDKKRLLKK